jgi:CRISPR-associated protein Cas1
MAWRGLHLRRAARLSLADGQMVVAQEDGEVRLPIEDIAYVVLDTQQATLTAALLSACMEAGIAVMVTDPMHRPSGLMLPFHRHHRQAGVAQVQAGISEPLRKRLWQAVVRAKIGNQAAVLDLLARPGAEALRAMARRVASGDSRNVEARAARDYWAALWRDFRREDDSDRRNALLNYGYAVIRAGVARALVAAGFLPAFGIGHASAANAFNLADDMMEPFRPLVDRLAWQVAGEGAAGRAPITLEDRRAMAGILMADARMGTQTQTLLVATETMSDSLLRAMENGTAAALALPALPD